MNASQEDGGIDLFGCESWRADVVDGLNGVEEGVDSALRFCVMESSIVERERRRKSVIGGLIS